MQKFIKLAFYNCIKDGKKIEPMYTTGGADRSGMGFTIMESFMDTMRVRSQLGKGTTLTLRKKISRRMSHGE